MNEHDKLNAPQGPDYLWDRSGPVDPEIERLETLLSVYGAEERPLRLPAREPAGLSLRAWRFGFALAACAVIVIALLAYRNFNKISHSLGTAVNVQSMAFGNMGSDSGTGVAFTRNPSTGERELYGEYLLNAQGEDVVAGIRTPSKISKLEQDLPHVFQQFQEIAKPAS